VGATKKQKFLATLLSTCIQLGTRRCRRQIKCLVGEITISLEGEEEEEQNDKKKRQNILDYNFPIAFVHRARFHILEEFVRYIAFERDRMHTESSALAELTCIIIHIYSES
jgi:hypothetical protein